MLIKYILATSMITLLPGPSMMLVVMNTLKKGIHAGLWTILGVLLADALLLTLTMTGIGASLNASCVLYAAIKWMGACYLLYLGFTTLMAKSSVTMAPIESHQNPTMQAIGITLLNPKILLFFIAFFPPFINPDQSLIAQYGLLAPLFLSVVGLILLGYLGFAHNIKKALCTPQGHKMAQWIGGLCFIGFGLAAATA